MSELAFISILLELQSSTCQAPHVGGALLEYSISFHCMLVNQDLPAEEKESKRKRERERHCD